jgi:hypothetical protein
MAARRQRAVTISDLRAVVSRSPSRQCSVRLLQFSTLTTHMRLLTLRRDAFVYSQYCRLTVSNCFSLLPRHFSGIIKVRNNQLYRYSSRLSFTSRFYSAVKYWDRSAQLTTQPTRARCNVGVGVIVHLCCETRYDEDRISLTEQSLENAERRMY